MYNKRFAKPSSPAAWGSVAVRPCSAGGYAPQGGTCTGAWPAPGPPQLLKHWQGAGREPGWLRTERKHALENGEFQASVPLHDSDWLQAVYIFGINVPSNVKYSGLCCSATILQP